MRSSSFRISTHALCVAAFIPVTALFATTTQTVDTTGGDITKSDVISGDIAITKTGTGTLTLTAQNTYTGGTTISAGTLRLADGTTPIFSSNYPYTVTLATRAGTLGSGAVTNDATLAFDPSRALFIANNISGSGIVTQTGAGITTLTGNNTFTGGIRLTAGTLAAGGENALGSGVISFEGGTLRLNAPIVSQPGAVATAYTTDHSSQFSTATGQRYKIDTAGSVVTFAANLDGLDAALLVANTFPIVSADKTQLQGALTGNFTGALKLTGNNRFTAGVEIASGVLEVGSAGAFGDTGEIKFSGGTLRYSAANTTDYAARFVSSGSDVRLDTNGQSVTFDASVSTPSAKLVKTGAGSLTLNAANNVAGVTVENGSLIANHAGALGSGPVSIKGTIPTAFGMLTIGAGPIGWTYSGANISAITAPASGETQGHLVLNQDITGVGAVTVEGGAIEGPGSLSAESYYLTSATVSAVLTGSGALTVGTSSYFFGAAPVSTLSASNTYTGGTTVQYGTLVVTHPGALGTGDITVNGINGTGAANNTLSLPTSFTAPTTEDTGNTSTGAITLNGTLTIGGGNTYTGATTIKLGNGILGLGGNTFATGGTLTLSADVVTPGNLVLTGGTINGTGSLKAALFDVRAGNIAAKLTGTGALVKSGDGTVELSGANNYTGGTTVNAGKLSVTASGTLNGTVTVNGGVLYLGADQTLAKLDLTTRGGLSVDSGETRIHAGNLAGNIVVASGATLSLDGSARIVQPEGGHPDNAVVTPSGAETLATSVLLVNGTLNLIGNDHMLGMVTGAGDIHLQGGATYSMVASRFTGRWFLGDQTPEPATPESGTPSTPDTPAPRPSPTGGLSMNGTIVVQGDESRATDRVINISGSGEAIVINDWANHDTVNIRDGITFNLGQGVSHSVEADLIQIDSGATLKGLGTITGSVVNNGRIAPGNSPGVITVGGDFTNGPAGVVDIEVAGVNPGTGYDVIRYAGQAILNGGTLNVTLIDGFTPGSALRIHFLEDTDLANGSPSVVGAFTTVNLPSNLYTRLVTDDTGVSAFLSPTLTGMPGVSVSNALLGADQATGANAPLQAALQAAYAASGGAAAGDALRAVSPIGFGALPGMSFDAARDDVRTVTDRAAAHRSLALVKSDIWEAYVGYTGRFSEAKSGVNAPAYDSNIQNGHVGLENVVAESLIVGVTPAYARGEASLNNGSGKIDMDRAAVTGYVAYAEEDTVAQVGLRAGYLNYDTKRTHLLGTDRASTDGFELGAFAGVSHALRVGDFRITPEASLGYTYAEIGGFSETGTAAALRVRSITQDSLRARLGSSFDWLPVNETGSTLAIGIGLGAEQELLKQHADIRASYAGGSAFDTASAMNARTTLDVGPQLTWTFDTTNAIRAGYRYEYGFDDTVSHRVDVSYSKRF